MANGGTVSAYNFPVAVAQYYPAASYDPPQPFNPYVPMLTASSAGQPAGKANMPLIGLVVVGRLIVLLHEVHRRAERGGRG